MPCDGGPVFVRRSRATVSERSIILSAAAAVENARNIPPREESLAVDTTTANVTGGNRCRRFSNSWIRTGVHIMW
jgi:hypothetical protein